MNNPTPPKRERFWKRQTADTITRPQKIFDVIVGAIIPILLLIFDPAVFRTGGACVGPLLPDYAIFAYLAIGLGILALIGWLFVSAFKRSIVGFVAGILLTGGLFAAGIGVAIAPSSVVGLVVLLGALGFLPFFTAFVYYRNGLRAYRVASLLSNNKTRLMASMLAGAIVVIGVPAVAQAGLSNVIQHSTDIIVENQTVSNQTAISDLRTLNQLCLTLCTSTIESAFDHAISVHADQKTSLTMLYQQITGTPFVSASCETSE